MFGLNECCNCNRPVLEVTKRDWFCIACHTNHHINDICNGPDCVPMHAQFLQPAAAASSSTASFTLVTVVEPAAFSMEQVTFLRQTVAALTQRVASLESEFDSLKPQSLQKQVGQKPRSLHLQVGPVTSSFREQALRCQQGKRWSMWWRSVNPAPISRLPNYTVGHD